MALIAAMGLLSLSCRSPHQHAAPAPVVYDPEPRKSWSSQEGEEHILGIREFAFGDIGSTRAISDGEYAFRAILRSPAAPELFRSAYSQATMEGQLYILCGIRVTSRGSFDDYASPLLKDTRNVTTISGDVVKQEPIAEVVKRIADGAYDSYFPKPPPVEQPPASK
jgi:hypothetical protein